MVPEKQNCYAVHVQITLNGRLNFYCRQQCMDSKGYMRNSLIQAQLRKKQNSVKHKERIKHKFFRLGIYVFSTPTPHCQHEINQIGL